MYFTQQLDIDSVKEVLKLRAIAIGKASDFNVKAEYWFAQSTGRIGQLKKIENQLGHEILTLVEDKQATALNSLIVNR